MVELAASAGAFSALRSDGQVVSWGAPLAGGRTCAEVTGVVKVVGALDSLDQVKVAWFGDGQA